MLAVPFIITGDATKQPAPPAGMMYKNATKDNGAGDPTQYPVLLLGPWSIWCKSSRILFYYGGLPLYAAVTDINGGDLPKGALLFFDTNNNLVKTNNSIVFPPMYNVHIGSFDYVDWMAGNRMSWGFVCNGLEKY